MSGARSRPSIPTIVEGGVVYDTNQEKAELFSKKFAAVSSDENLSAITFKSDVLNLNVK